MTAPDNFLSRWSRRKLEADKPETDKLDLPQTIPAPVDNGRRGDEEATEIVAPGREEALSAEELATLPRVEDLTPASDLSPFMRAGVPALLRNAALRRMWTLDPAIRDFVGEARDYSYDWNVPGGVPVSGPLMPTDDVEGTLARMFSRPLSEEADDPPATPPEPDLSDTRLCSDRAEPTSPACEHLASEVVILPPGDERSGPEPEPVEGPRSDKAASSTSWAEPVDTRRRHGAAVPKLD